MLHGWAMHSGAWGDLPARLARRMRVHAVDLPGHGRSAPLRDFALNDVVAALDAAFARESSPMTVLGWSLGGLLAMRWALAAPARLARLILVSTTPRFAASEDWPQAMSEAALKRFGDELHVAWKAAVQRFLALQLRGSVHGRTTLALMRGQLFAHGEPSPGALAGALDVLARTDLRGDVAAIAQPTLVITGDRDRVTPPDAGLWLADHLPNGRGVMIAGAGHAPFLSHPAAFGVAVDEFFDDDRA